MAPTAAAAVTIVVLAALLSSVAWCAHSLSFECEAFRRLTEVDEFPHNVSIYYVKTPKTASSTTGGVLRAVAMYHNISGSKLDGKSAARNSRTKDGGHVPFIFATHASMTYLMQLRMQMRDLNRSGVRMFSSLRDPVSRALSGFYHFDVTRKEVANSEEVKLNFLKNVNDVQWKWLKTKKDSVEATMMELDFVFVQDRYVESMLAFALHFRVPMRDVLFVSAKNSTEHPLDSSAGQKNAKKALVEHPALVSEPPLVREYAKSAEFRKNNKNDFAMVRIAQRRLDQLIDSFDPNIWAAALRIYQSALHDVQARCSPPPGKVPVDCMWKDNGCAIGCIASAYARIRDRGCAPFEAGPEKAEMPAASQAITA